VNLRTAWQADWIDCNRFAGVARIPPRCEDVQTSGWLRYCRTDHVVTEANLRRLAQGGPCVLITHASDAAVTLDMVRRLPPNVIRWFACHVECEDPRVECLPVGFIYSADVLNWLVQQSLAGRPERRNLLYMNHTRVSPVYHGCRDGIWERFDGKPWVTARERVAFEVFFADLAAHDYVLSPPGCGPDCHRHWEAMALGTVPVVLRTGCASVLEGLPALVVDSWAEVTEARLQAALPDLHARFDSESMRKLTLSYWRERILAVLP
jgi:hypothetical protein